MGERDGLGWHIGRQLAEEVISEGGGREMGGAWIS
jgi:hypothetical protein